MNIAIEGQLERVLLRLAKHNHEPTATGMVRSLIRNAAKVDGVWEEDNDNEPEPQPTYQNGGGN